MRTTWKIIGAYALGAMAVGLLNVGGKLIDAGNSSGWLLMFLVFLTASLTSFLLTLEKP